jgi:hypothetical protein
MAEDLYNYITTCIQLCPWAGIAVKLQIWIHVGLSSNLGRHTSYTEAVRGYPLQKRQFVTMVYIITITSLGIIQRYEFLKI